MIRIANFVLDEKFIDYIIDFHDVTSDQCHHDYYLVRNIKKPIKWIKKNIYRVVIIDESKAIELANTHDAVFLHTLFGMPIHLIPKIDKKVKVFWHSWGYDIYDFPSRDPLVKVNQFKPLTKKYINRSFRDYILTFAVRAHSFLNKRSAYYFRKAVDRIDYFSGIFEEEYDLIKQNKYPFFHAKPFDYALCDISFAPKKEDIEVPVERDRKNIIIGNSTAYGNNHLDVLDILSQIDVSGRIIYMPLSYGGNPNYVKAIIKAGRVLLSDNFEPLTDFLPANDYRKMLGSCGFAIYAIERQMAIGNVIICLRSGVKVFLPKTSVIYKHFINMGILVFTIEEDLMGDCAFTPLTDEEVFHNRRIIYETRNLEVMLNKLRNIYKLIESR